MHRRSITVLVGMFALTITGCGSGGAESTNNTASNTANTQQPVKSTTTAEKPTLPKTPQKPETVAQNPQNDKEKENQEKKNTGFSSAAGLIQPTNVNQRTKQVQQGRPDPFAGLFAIPKPVVAVKPKIVPRLPKPVVAPPPPKPVVIKPAPLPPPAPIEPPQPDLAKAVSVLGVLEIGNQYQAIVKVPNEATSRNVSQGQRLSDGQVLVKRIEMYPGSEPIVILEQNGIEVSRAVGQEPAQPDQQGNPTNAPSSTIQSPRSLPSRNFSPRGRYNTIQLDNSGSIPVPPPPPSDQPLSEKQIRSELKIGQPRNTIATSTPSFPKNPSSVGVANKLEPDYPPTTTQALRLRPTNNTRSRKIVSVPEPNYPPVAIREVASQPTSKALSRAKLISKLKSALSPAAK